MSYDTVKITELPIGMWTEDYKHFLESLLIDKSKPNKRQILLKYEDNSTECDVDFTLKFQPVTLMRLLKHNPDKNGIPHMEKVLKLTTTKYTNLSNMHLYDYSGKIKQYNTVSEIIDEFMQIRYEFYVKRKSYILEKLKKDLELINYRVLFINEILNDTIDLRKKKKAEIYKLLEDKQYPKLCIGTNGKTNTYDYLIKMPLDTLTEEKVKELEKLKADKEIEYNTLESKTEYNIWNSELKQIKTKISTMFKKDIKEKKAKLKLKIKSVSNKVKKTKK